MDEPADTITSSASDVTREIESIGDADPSGVAESLSQVSTDMEEPAGVIKDSATDIKDGIEEIGESFPTEGVVSSLNDVAVGSDNALDSMDEWTKYRYINAVKSLAEEIPAIGKAFDETTGKINMTKTEFESMVKITQNGILQATIDNARNSLMSGYAEAALSKAQMEAALAQALAEAGEAAGRTFK
jgi:hypothetical protein